MNGDPLPDQSDPQLPGPLRAELSRVYRVDASAVPAVDQKILNRARAHFARRGKLRLLLEVGAVAAMLLFVVGVAFSLLTPHDLHMRQARQMAARGGGDVNGDGVVDIRDALLLARELDAGTAKGCDLNHDGVTDHKDVDAIAMMAVRLQPTGATQ